MGDLPRTGSALSNDELDSVDAVAAFHEAHHSQTGRLQNSFDRLTARMGRPLTLVAMIVVVGGWIVLARLSGGPLDGPLFAWLELSATVTALLVAVLILVTQRRADLLAERRAQLTLELALLSDRKNAKIIALLEELRRDAPAIANRFDAESAAMATPADLDAVAAATDERRES